MSQSITDGTSEIVGENISLDAVKQAQRTSPHAPETKALQAAYEKQKTELRRALEASQCRARQASEQAERETLLNELLQPRELMDGALLCVVSVKWAQWAGNAPAVAGGWVAVDLPGVSEVNALFSPRNRIALLPASWSDEEHVSISITEVAKIWAEECLDNDQLREAVVRLNSCSKEGGEA